MQALGFFCVCVCVYVPKWLLLAMLMGFISLAPDNQMAANAAQQLRFCFTADYVFLARLPAHAVVGSSGGSEPATGSLVHLI